MQTHSYQLGTARITRVTDTLFPGFRPEALYADWDSALLDEQPALRSVFDATGEHIILRVHSWVVETDGQVFLIDTGLGNDKERPFNAIFHRQQNPFLERLAAIGIRPEDVDHVLLTHLHVDHVGWNTRLVDGRWRPTFPNARYALPQGELDFYASSEADSRLMVFDDSVAPVIAAGQAVNIGHSGGDYRSGFQFHPTPGHSAGHMMISLQSGGQTAMFSGDIMHSPLQVYRPQWNSVFCRDQQLARDSRLRLLEEACRRDALLFTAHFGLSSAGKVQRRQGGYDWNFV